jgi:hypothetical protein
MPQKQPPRLIKRLSSNQTWSNLQSKPRHPRQDLEEGPLAHQNLDAGASTLIPVPAPLGGAIVVGESVVTYFSAGSPQYQRSAALKQTIVRVRGVQSGGGGFGRFLFV